MKKCLFILFVGVFTNIYSQTQQSEYQSMLTDGRLWKVSSAVGTNNPLYSCFIKGDTVINGKVWKKLYSDYNQSHTMMYYGAVRNVDSKVFIYGNGDDRERLLYNFALKEGDVIGCDQKYINSLGYSLFYMLDREDESFTYHKMRLDSIDMIKLNDKELHRWHFSSDYIDKSPSFGMNPGATLLPIVWVEGIGSDGGFIMPWRKQESSVVDCYLNDEMDFSSTCFYIPAVETGIEVCLSNRLNDIFYNLDGRRLQQVPEKGVYIVNGRKMVRK